MEIGILCLLVLNFLLLTAIFSFLCFYVIENWGKLKTYISIGKKGKKYNIQEKEKFKKTLVETLFHFSSKKIGALIVFEKGSALGLYEETGFQVNCNFSPEFVISVFTNKHSSFHDGAMIISDFKVKSISCYLPVSKKIIGVKYGARHRAALGITEKTDAIAFVVSETTGFISIAKNGNLLTLKNEKETMEEYINNEINEL